MQQLPEFPDRLNACRFVVRPQFLQKSNFKHLYLGNLMSKFKPQTYYSTKQDEQHVFQQTYKLHSTDLP